MLTRGALLTTAAFTLGLSGCFYSPGTGPGPGPGPIQIGSGAGDPGFGTTATGILAGAGLDNGNVEGYIITASPGAFRITWIGYREFSGSVFANPGALGKVYPGCTDGACALATSEDAVVVTGDRIDFGSFPASGKRSGFDIEVADGQLALDLLIEDPNIGSVRDPQAINFVSSITGQPATSPDDPLVLIIRDVVGTGGPPPPAPAKHNASGNGAATVPAPNLHGNVTLQPLWQPGQGAAKFGPADSVK